MTTTIFAQPYGDSSKGFMFSTVEEFKTGYAEALDGGHQS